MRVHIKGQAMLFFRKILRTYGLDKLDVFELLKNKFFTNLQS